jgi:hypothetical protein
MNDRNYRKSLIWYRILKGNVGSGQGMCFEWLRQGWIRQIFNNNPKGIKSCKEKIEMA